MKKNVIGEKGKKGPFLLLLFTASFAVHALLHLLLFRVPTVMIDEALYTNLARSLAWEGNVAFRGQPVDYYYLMYPLVLVPVYWLHDALGGNLYQYVQIFNTLLITSSVIPAYLFAESFIGEKKKAGWTALLVSLMPDMIMGGYEMAESLIWPLTLWLLYFAWKLYANGRLRDGLASAVISGLLFFTKPGAVAIGAALIGCFVVLSFTSRKQYRKSALVSLLVLLGMVGAVYGVKAWLVPDTSLMGLYSKQTSQWRGSDWWVALEAIPATCFLFLFACGGCFGLVPVFCRKRYAKEKQGFIMATALGVLISVIGTAFFVVPYQWTGAVGQIPLHLRYCAMLIPAFWVFSLGMDEPFRREEKGLKTALIIFAVLAVFPGVRLGFVPGETTTIDSMTLSAFVHTKVLNAGVTGWLLSLTAAGFSVYAALSLKKGWNEKLQRSCAGYLAAFLLFNTLCGYVNVHFDADRTIVRDAREVNEWVGDETCLGVTQRYYDDMYGYWLESQLNRPMQQVTFDQMFSSMDETMGVYVPFVPLDQIPNIGNHETPETHCLLLGKTVAEHLELNASASARKTENGHFTLVHLTPRERWVDTMMYGLNRNTLEQGDKGYIRVFDAGRSQNGRITLQITAAGKGTLDIHGSLVQLEKQAKTYEVSVPFAGWIPLQCMDGDVEITSYSTVKYE